MSEILFDIEVPRSFFGPLELRDGSLLAGDVAHHALHSSDGGRTWDDAGPMRTDAGKPICTGPDRPGYVSSMIRLASGAIGLKFDDRLTPQAGLSSGFSSYFTRSIDEGDTWSDPAAITRPGTPANATWMIQTRAGRLVLANEYAFTTPSPAKHSTMNLCTAFYSDDHYCPANV